MKKTTLIASVLALITGLVVTLPTPTVSARPAAAKKHKSKKSEKKDEAEPGTLKAAVRVSPKGLKFEQSRKKVTKVYFATIERDYLPRYKEAEPGIQTRRLKFEIKQKKDRFRGSWIDFDDTGSSYDSTPLAGEFGYKSKEAMMTIKRRKKQRFLFFIQKKLWKTIDVYKLGKGRRWGLSFESAVKKLEKKLGKGRHLDADPDAGRTRREVEWANDSLHLRVFPYGKKKFAIAYVHVGTEKNLKNLRKKAKDKKKVSDKTKDAMRK